MTTGVGPAALWSGPRQGDTSPRLEMSIAIPGKTIIAPTMKTAYSRKGSSPLTSTDWFGTCGSKQTVVENPG